MTTESLRKVDIALPATTQPQYSERLPKSDVFGYEPDPLEVHFGRPLPVQLIKRYAKAAVRRAVLKQYEDGTWFAKIPGFRGVWASEPSEQETLEILEEVVVDWAVLKIQHKDRDLPVIDTIDLNVL